MTNCFPRKCLGIEHAHCSSTIMISIKVADGGLSANLTSSSNGRNLDFKSFLVRPRSFSSMGKYGLKYVELSL